MERAKGDVLRSVRSVADVADANRRAIAVGDDDVVVRIGLGQLIVGRDGEALVLAEECALGGVGRGIGKCAANVFEGELPRHQLGWIDLNANCRPLLTADDDLGDAGYLRNLLGNDVLGEIVDFGQRDRLGRRRHDQDRRIRRVDLAIGRRCRKGLR